jgi:hypothetical protein
LPIPWNIIPSIYIQKGIDLKMLLNGDILAFNGEKASYYHFQKRFRRAVHEVHYTVTSKAMILAKLLTSAAADLDRKHILPEEAKVLSMLGAMNSGTKEDYEWTIRTLEGQYGGADGHHADLLDVIRATSRLRKDDLPGLWALIVSIKRYLQAQETHQGKGSDNAPLLRDVYRTVRDKLPSLYLDAYTDSLRDDDTANIYTLHTWMEKRHKRAVAVGAKPKTDAPQETGRSIDRSDRRSESRYSGSRSDGRSGSRRSKPFVRAFMIGGDGDQLVEIEPKEEVSGEDNEEDNYFADQNRKVRFKPKNNRPSPGGRNTTSPKKKCPCDKHDLLKDCAKFKSMTPSERRRFVAESGKCYRCLSSSHLSRDCDRKAKAICTECSQPHHTFLHDPDRESVKKTNALLGTTFSDVPSETEQSEKSEEEEQTFANVARYVYITAERRRRRVALRIVPVKIQGYIFNALLDDGATHAFLSRRAAKILELSGETMIAEVAGIGNITTKYKTCQVQFQVESLDGTCKKKITAKVMPELCGKVKPIDWNQAKKKYEHLQNITFPQVDKEVSIDLIIGNSTPSLLTAIEKEVEGKNDNEPTARKTRLGWTAVGLVETQDHVERAHVARVKDEIDGGAESSGDVTEKTEDSETQKRSTQELEIEEVAGKRVGDYVYFITGKDECFKTTASQLNEELKDMLQKQFCADALPGDSNEEKKMSEDELQAIKIMEESAVYENGKYTVSCLWKTGEPPKGIPNSYDSCLTRLRSLMNSKALREEKTRTMYFAQIEDWLKKGYVRIVEEEEIPKDTWHLPHFAVVKMERTTTKIRPVFDGAAKVKGVGLNDWILPGPNYINSLNGVLTKFRLHPVALGGDISEMFLRVGLREEDRPYHRFLWPNPKDPNGKPQVREFLVHSFGNTGSPSVSMYVIRKHASRFKDSKPQAYQVVLDGTIVDDNLTSVKTVKEANLLIQDLSEIYSGCNMTIKKWTSNIKAVMETVPEADRGIDINVVGISEDTKDGMILTRMLGVLWLAGQDVFTFVMTEPEEDIHWTKRKLSSYFARIFDPLGMISPFIIIARCLMQETWVDKMGWDEALKPEHLIAWKKWLATLKHLAKIRVKRCLTGSLGDVVLKSEAHFFADASGTAYGAVGYLVSELKDGRTIVRFIASKARVASRTLARSIPRLELMALQVAVKLAMEENKSLKLDKKNIHYWTDARDVLWWVKGSKDKQLLTFVSNRVAYIKDYIVLENLRWVPTDQNPADHASRGLLADKLVETLIWWEGPDFLETKNFPTQPSTTRTVEAEKEMRQIARTEDTIMVAGVERKMRQDNAIPPVMDREDKRGHSSQYSRWQEYFALVRVMLFWKQKAAGKTKPGATHRDYALYQLTWKHVWRTCQSESLAGTLDEITKYGKLKKENEMASLRPAIAEDGLLRVHSRLKSATHLPYAMKCPIIVHKDHDLVRTYLLYLHIHVLQHTGGPTQLLAEAGKHLWIPRGRNLARRIVRNCQRCHRSTARTQEQEMADLPDVRIAPGKSRPRAFQSTGIDLCGPFFTRRTEAKTRATATNRNKRWIVVSTCAVFRAVHLDIVRKLNSVDILNFFTRFMARRGRPQVILSDNGTNFVGAKGVLDDAANKRMQDAHPDIDWRLNTPAAPHCGGFFETKVKAVKRALYTQVHHTDPTDEELQTIVIGIEGMINNCPLSYTTTDAGELEPITPAMFLSTGPVDDLPRDLEGRQLLVQNWKRVQEQLDQFWQRFVHEYLPQHNQHPRGPGKEPRTIAKGDVVIVLEGKKRGRYPLGTIEEVIPGPQGICRTVEVRFNGTTSRRPIKTVVAVRDE